MDLPRPTSPPVIRCRLAVDTVGSLATWLEREVSRQPAGSIVCEVSRLGSGNAMVVDGLARAALAARRAGWRLRLEQPSRELAELIELMGLTETLLGPGEAIPGLSGSTEPSG